MDAQDHEDIDRMQAFARGQAEMTDLPLEDTAFWRKVLAIAAQPGRHSARRPQIWAAANCLLEGLLLPSAQDARRLATIEQVSATQPEVRRKALSLLLGSPADQQIVEVVARCALEDTDCEVQIAAIHFLAWHPVPLAIASLLRILQEAADVRRAIAAEALTKAGRPAIAGLTQLLSHRNSSVRWHAARCLAHINKPESLPGLLQAFHDDSADVAWVGADGLVALGPDYIESVLKSILSSRLTGVTIRALRHYAEQTSPRRLMRRIITGTSGSAPGIGALVAIDETLREMAATKTLTYPEANRNARSALQLGPVPLTSPDAGFRR